MPLAEAHTATARLAKIARQFPAHLVLSIYNDLERIENEWRSFEQIADCTVFQTFEWLSTWQRNIGQHDNVIPVIVIASFPDGETAFILPLAIEQTRLTRRLCWLGQELCDYTAPLLAPDFSQRVTPDRFVAAWKELCDRLQSDAKLRFDRVELEKMPQKVGDQANPFTHLDLALNPSGAHLTRLGDDWEKYYFDKRSSETRRHDRMKQRRMSEFGEVRFVSATEPEDIRRTLELLMAQKSRVFARNGIPNIFARPGCREFFFDLAQNPQTRSLVHVSRIEIGENWAATNLGVVFGERYYHVLSSYNYDLEFSRFGPGLLHLREIMAHAIGLGLLYFDFTIGDERYKLEWSEIHLNLYDYAVAATWRGWLASAWSTARRRLKRLIKQTPPLWRLAGRIRLLLGALHRAPAP